VGAKSAGDLADSVYVFERDDAGVWNEAAKLTPSDLAERPFGSGIAIYGDTALIGGNRGAYVFNRNPQGSWQEVARLPQPGQNSSLALFGDTALVSHFSPIFTEPPTLITNAYRRDEQNNWNQIATFPGQSRGIFGDTFILSADSSLSIYQLIGIAEGDYNRSGAVNNDDLNLVLSNWNTNEVHPPIGWYSQLPKGAIDQDELNRVVLNWPQSSGPLNLTPAVASGALSANWDLKTNAAFIDHTGAGPVATVRQQILSSRGGPGLGASWTGQGITSSTVATANTTEPEARSIGYGENSAMPLGPYTTFNGQPVDSSSVLIAYTRTGDANLDGMVNDDDVTIIGATYAPGVPQPHWALGDFDYNGFVDDDDVTLLGAFYDPSTQPLITPAPADTAVAAVPEPASWMLVASSLVALSLFAIRRCLLSRSEGAT
jgi:hypothetical protein